MSQQYQDWGQVTWSKTKPTGSKSHDDKVVNQARREGADVDVQKKYLGGQNHGKGVCSNAKKLDEENELVKHDRVGPAFRQALQQARLAKKLTQAQLANVVNEKPSVINEYESGKAIPNGQVVGKLARALGVNLPSPKV